MKTRQSKSGSQKQNAHKTQPKSGKGSHQVALPDTNDHSKCFGDWQCRRPEKSNTDMMAAVEQMLEGGEADVKVIHSNPQEVADQNDIAIVGSKGETVINLSATPTTHPL